MMANKRKRDKSGEKGRGQGSLGTYTGRRLGRKGRGEHIQQRKSATKTMTKTGN